PKRPAGNIEYLRGGYYATFFPYKITMQLKSYSPNAVEKEITINCGDPVKNIWGLQIAPQCVPPGLRAEYQNTTQHSISLGIVGLDEPPIYLSPGQPMMFGLGNSGGAGNLRSSSKEITLRIISSPPSR
ncbi:hypothetical protein, partial [Klebsiella pneumoniae]|uniref:hypothetical protein n=1 Tax=Klebsiella pneumoniae TaxID=573 RepID=UPI0021D1E563